MIVVYLYFELNINSEIYYFEPIVLPFLEKKNKVFAKFFFKNPFIFAAHYRIDPRYFKLKILFHKIIKV